MCTSLAKINLSALEENPSTDFVFQESDKNTVDKLKSIWKREVTNRDTSENPKQYFPSFP